MLIYHSIIFLKSVQEQNTHKYPLAATKRCADKLMENVPKSSHFEYMYQDSHLSGSELEAELCDFELAMQHLQEAFRRWSTHLYAAIRGDLLPLQDVSVLQVLRMREHPKSVLDIAHALNREDSANIAYSLRKLEKLGLAERPTDARQSATVYQVTEIGRETTDQYALMRREILVPLLRAPDEFRSELEQCTIFMNEMVGLYDYAARRVAMLRPAEATLASGKKQRRSRPPKRKIEA